MIYRVVLDDLYDLHTSDINCMLLNPSLELEMNSAGSFNFRLPPTHPYWNSIEILKSTIDVYEDDDLIFTGRVANIDKNWNNERVVECEGALAYFNDSIHRQMKWETPLPIASEDPNVHNFLKDILDNHNVFVGDATNRQIHVGHIYVDPYLVTREVDYDTTLDILTRMCIDTNGGYFMIRKDLETHLLYLDWLKDFTEESGQPASFGVNLLDFNTGLHAEDICTGVLARGATVNDQVVTLSNVELVDETTYPDLDVDHYTTHDQDILWHRAGMAKFGRVVQVHEFPDAQTDWKNDGQIVDNSLFEEAKKWLEEKNTKVESIEVEVAELSWLRDGVPKYKLGQIVEILDDAHMAGESYDVRRLPMYKLSCDLSSGSKKVTLGRPPKKELTQISASNSDSSTLSSGNSSGSSSGGGSGEECKVHDVRVDGTSVVTNKIASISLTGKADVSTVNALAATVATKADTATVNALANVVAGKQDQIEFNTQEAATEVLTRLKANNVVYNLGGGTEVEANPSESATDDLETIKIGNTVYDISGGGSTTNYGKFKCDVLFNTPTSLSGWSNPLTICTKSVVEEYDALVLTFGVTHQETATILVADLLSTQNGRYSYLPTTNANGGNFHVSGLRIDSNDNLLFYVDVSGDYLYKVYGLKFENKLINRSDIYSEEERMIGRWTDGKPLYQKTINFGTLPNNTTKTVSSGLTNVVMHNIFGVAIAPNGFTLTLPHREISGNGNIDIVYQADNYVRLKTDYDYSSYTSYITLQYTKTTDAPGSGFLPEDPQMVMMSDYYSENEQVVGRWTDGKPIYQKTYLLGSGVYITNNGISIASYLDNLSTYDQIIDAVGYGKNNNDSRADSLYLNTTGMAYCAEGMTTNRVTVRYTKTTDAPGTGPTKGNLIYLPALYSEEEREVGVWTDGKPIYQKTMPYDFTSSVNDWTLFDDSVSYEKMVAVIPIMKATNSSEDQIMQYGDSETVPRWCIKNDHKMYYYLNNARRTGVVTFQYTKTTDQPGSGTWTPEGQLAHHYSTSEKIVGTWIDGSTLYERTLDLGSDTAFPNYTWTSIVNNVDIPIDKIIKCEGVQADQAAVSFDIWYDSSSNSLKARSLRDGNEIIRYFTIQYTKSS